MRVLIKIGLFVMVVAFGIFIIDNSLSAVTSPCNCQNEHDAYLSCKEVCNEIGEDCLDTHFLYSGCEYRDCVTLWKFECEYSAEGYIQNEVTNCPDCYNW